MHKKNKTEIVDGELIDKRASSTQGGDHRFHSNHLIRLRNLLHALKANQHVDAGFQKIHRVWLESLRKLKPYAMVAWNWINERVEWFLAKTDHHSLNKPRATLRITGLFFLIMLVWAAVFQIDQVIHAQGQIIASSRTQVIQAADGGVLAELLVQEGDEVTAGQVIAILEKDRALAAYTESFGKVVALRLTVARLRAEVLQSEPVFDKELYEKYPVLVETQFNLFYQRNRGYLDQIRILESNVKLAEEELRMNIPLEKLGDVSKVDILRLRRGVNEAKSSLVNFRTRYFQDASAELNKAEEDLSGQEQSLKDRAQLLEHTNIIAPTAGIVKNIRVTTLGGVVRQGDELMHIFPTESDLIVESKVKPVDMAYLKPGLPATVKLDAYDYSIFGAMKGKVLYISPDSLTDETRMGPETYYRVRVGISNQEVQRTGRYEIEMKPGMTTMVDIKTDQRSVLTFLMKPLVKTLNTSMGER